MAYTAEIRRGNPTAFLFLIDQSGSMEDKMQSGRSKAQFVADVLNRTIATLIVRCTKPDGVRDYFDVGVMGYGGNGAINALQGSLASKILNPISALESSPAKIDERRQKVDDGAGGIIEQPIKFQVWVEPGANGKTPMCAAVTKAAEELAAWCDAHPSSYPPTVLHISDGESTDGDPEPLADKLRQMKTDDGNVLMFSLHVSVLGNPEIKYPTSELALPDAYGKMLFRMSSQLPDHLVKYAQEKGSVVGAEARGFFFNAEAPGIAEFFDIGTRPSQLR